MAELAGFARALDAGSVACTAYDRPSCRRKREHVLATESAKAPAMLRYRSPGVRRVIEFCPRKNGRTASGT